MSNAATLLIVTQSSSSYHSAARNIYDSDDDLTILSNMLTTKFSNQQKGKIKWIKNRADHLNSTIKFKGFIPIEWMKDTEIVLTFINNQEITQQNVFQVLPEFLMEDPRVAMELLKNRICNVDEVPGRFMDDREFMLEYLTHDPRMLRFSSFCDDEDFNVELIARRRNVILFIAPELKNSQSFKDKLMKVDKYLGMLFAGYALNGDTDEKLRNDKDFVMAALMLNGNALQFASDELKSDPDVIVRALGDIYAIQHMPKHFFKDLHFMKRLILEVPSVIEMAPFTLIDNKEFMLEILSKNGSLIYYASENLRMDKEAVLIAVAENPDAIIHVFSFYDDRDVQLLANHSNFSFLYLADVLRSDREFVFEMVKKQGLALQYADSSLQSDKSLVREAVKSNEGSFFYASAELQSDKEFVIDLVKAGYPSVL